MGARCRSFDTQRDLPEFLYLDTGFLVDALLGGSQERQEAADFLDSLLASGSDIIASDLGRLEFWNVALKVAIQQKYGKHDWYNVYDTPGLRKEFLPEVKAAMDALHDLLGKFAYSEPSRGQLVQLTEECTRNAAHNILTHNLNSFDAAHLGIMQTYDLSDIATTDGDYLNVSGLILWLPRDICRKFRDRG